MVAATSSRSKESEQRADPLTRTQRVDTTDLQIKNKEFIRELKDLKKLRSFVRRTSAAAASDTSLDALNLLQSSSRGREPTIEEWREVEIASQRLYSHLTQPLRHKFALSAVTSLMALWALCLLGLASSSLLLVIELHTRTFVLTSYLFWLISLGAIGSIAFLGMNILSVQTDVTFELENRNQVILRIVLGALFGLVLTLPLGFDGFLAFTGYIDNAIYHHGITPTLDERPSEQWRQLALLLLPFILGFSTSLVITILNRLASGVQAVFGLNKDGSAERSKGQTSSAPPAPAQPAQIDHSLGPPASPPP